MAAQLQMTVKRQRCSINSSAVYTREDLQSMPDAVTNIDGCYVSTIDITEPDVLNLLRKLKSDKSPGPDNLHPRVLKECAAELARPLTLLFKTSMKDGTLPQAWKEANVTPIFKKGLDQMPVTIQASQSYLSVLQNSGKAGKECTAQAHARQQLYVRLSTWLCTRTFMYNTTVESGGQME